MTAREVPASGEEVDEFEYEGEDAIEAICLHGTQQVLGGYWDPSDTLYLERRTDIEGSKSNMF